MVLLFPASAANIEQGFSMMSLLISPLRTLLGEKNLDHMMHGCLNGTEKLLDGTVEKLINTFVATECCIDV